MKALHSVIAGITLGTLALTAPAHADSLISVPDSAALKWQDVAGTQGKVSYANVEGDIFGQGPYSAYVKFKKGTDNGLHQHTETLPTLVVKGTFYAVIDGKRTEFPAGAYYKLPANLVHEWLHGGGRLPVVQYQADAFDLKPVKG